MPHIHLPTPTHGPHAPSQNPFTPNSHTAPSLSTTLLTSFKKSILRQFFSSDCRSIYGLQPHLTTRDNEPPQLYYELFDEIFFFGSLSQRCTVELVEPKGLGIDGFTIKNCSLENGDIVSVISVHILGIRGREERLVAYLGILLHQMIHVFLLFYCCRDPECLDVVRRRGDRGYLYIWQDIAFALEDAVWELLGLNLDLLRKWALVEELSANREVWEEDMRWGFEGEDIRRLVRVHGARIRYEARQGKGLIEWLRKQDSAEMGIQVLLKELGIR